MKFENYMILDFPSRSTNEAFARSAVASFAAQMDPTLEELGDIRTAVSEAVTNCIVHAYPNELGTITLRCRILKDNTLDIVVKDRGIGIPDVEKAMQPMFLKGEFDAEPGVDTYVEFSEFGHGYIFINGFNLGRFDSAGPMMTLYLPGSFLKEKGNLIEVVDFAPKKFNSEIKLLDKHLLEGDAEHLK